MYATLYTIEPTASTPCLTGKISLIYLSHCTQREMAPIAAAGAWNMGRWDEMSEYVYAIDSGSASTSSANAFLRAVLDVHRQDYRRARGELSSQRNLRATCCGHCLQPAVLCRVGNRGTARCQVLERALSMRDIVVTWEQHRHSVADACHGTSGCKRAVCCVQAMWTRRESCWARSWRRWWASHMSAHMATWSACSS